MFVRALKASIIDTMRAGDQMHEALGVRPEDRKTIRRLVVDELYVAYGDRRER